jgi:hypothetical protein
MLNENQSSGRYFQLKGKNAEKVVQELANKTFLIDWCYANPLLPDGKELCDLLVVFDNTAIIWQVKDLKLNKEGFYKEKEFEKMFRQVEGARRQLFDLNTTIQLKNERRITETFDSKKIKNIHLISVLMGEECDFLPFMQNRNNKFIHVFTRDFVQIVMQELDTIADFTHYLQAKENLAREKSLLILGGEEELLASYILSFKVFPKVADSIKGLVLHSGSWEGLQEDERYKAKKKRDEISYLWDEIINRAHTGSPEYEIVARELARPNRFERRFLSRVFMESQAKAHQEKVYDMFRRVLPMKGVTYCFFFMDERHPRAARKEMLGALCLVARWKIPKNKKVIGIAKEQRVKRLYSYDFCLIDAPGRLPPEMEAVAEQLHKKHGILTNVNYDVSHESEFPEFEHNQE